MWTVGEEGFNSENITRAGNKFMIGNGYMGYRGTMEEYGRNHLVACNMAGIYDKKGDGWREPINVPNGFYTALMVEDICVGLLQLEPTIHKQQLELKEGLHRRYTAWCTEYGKVSVESERFLSLDNPHLMCLKFTIKSEAECQITIKTGIDGDIWDINGPHLENYDMSADDEVIALSARTQELKLPIVVGEACVRSFIAEETIEQGDKGIFRLIKTRAEAGVEYTIYKFITVYTGKDNLIDIKEKTRKEIIKAAAEGYSKAKSHHRHQWHRRWEDADIVIEGNLRDQVALRYSIYHLLIISPLKSSGHSIPARGLSGQTYKGGIFWDTEMFMLPFFLYTAPEVAYDLVGYRIKTLDGARRKAAHYGYRGAFYPWEGQETGDDACSDFNVTDVFTNRPIRTYFKDKQIHINAAVVYGIWETYRLTGDIELLLKGGAEVILECARFYYSYAYFKEDKDRYEILDVIGPDEYHERVNNNAYTNKMVHYTLDIALQTLDLLKDKHMEEYKGLIEKLNYDLEIEDIIRFKEKLYIVEANTETSIIQQFDGYDKLEDCTLAEVRERLLHPREYWGGAHGVAANTKIIKQADVVFLLYLFKYQYSLEVKKANWEYYQPRTEHGSSLSPCIYALLSCDIGNQDWAYPFFVKTATIDLTGESKEYAGSIYIGGTHPAANGGAWMTAVLGFGGLAIKEGEVTLNPRLPKNWNRLSFKIIVKGVKYHIDITSNSHKITRLN